MTSHFPGTTMQRDAVTLTAGAGVTANAVAEIVVHGSWSVHLGLEVTAVLRDCFTGRPRVVIVDLLGLVDEDAASLPLWLAARRAGNVLRPSARLGLCLPATTVLRTRLRRIGAGRLPLYATMAEARVAASAPPPGMVAGRRAW